MAVATTQLFSRQAALLATAVPRSIDSVSVSAAGAAVEYIVPAGTQIVLLSTDKICLFRDQIEALQDSGVAATIPTGQTDGEEAAWLHPGESRPFRVAPGGRFSFKGDGTNAALVTIERYTGTNATLPPD